MHLQSCSVGIVKDRLPYIPMDWSGAELGSMVGLEWFPPIKSTIAIPPQHIGQGNHPFLTVSKLAEIWRIYKCPRKHLTYLHNLYPKTGSRVIKLIIPTGRCCWPTNTVTTIRTATDKQQMSIRLQPQMLKTRKVTKFTLKPAMVPAAYLQVSSPS